MTILSNGHVADQVFAEVRQHFAETELVYLTTVIAAINFWNRLNIALRIVPGEYRPPKEKRAAK